MGPMIVIGISTVATISMDYCMTIVKNTTIKTLEIIKILLNHVMIKNHLIGAYWIMLILKMKKNNGNIVKKMKKNWNMLITTKISTIKEKMKFGEMKIGKMKIGKMKIKIGKMKIKIGKMKIGKTNGNT